MWLISTLVRYYRFLVDSTKEFFIRILMLILIYLGYVLLSLFIYAVMRRIMVPQKLHSIPVHFQYDSVCLNKGDESMCTFPQADFLLNDGRKLLRSGQYYRISLELEVPESQVNLDAGVFMANVTFYSIERQFITTSARPMAIRYKSDFLRFLYTLFFAIPLLFGLWEQKQTLELILFENYYEPYGEGALSAKIVLESNKIQIYSSSLTIDANFSGFTYYLYQWPLSMSVIVVISILITLCTCTLLLWMRDFHQGYEEQRALGRRRRQNMVNQRDRARGGSQSSQQRQQSQRSSNRNGETTTPVTLTRSEVSVVLNRSLTLDDERTESVTSGTVTPTANQNPDTGGEVVPGNADTADTADTESEVMSVSNADTGSEVSAGISEAISNLRALREELENDEVSSEMSSTSDMPGWQSWEEEGRASETGELRQRTGNL